MSRRFRRHGEGSIDEVQISVTRGLAMFDITDLLKRAQNYFFSHAHAWYGLYLFYEENV